VSSTVLWAWFWALFAIHAGAGLGLLLDRLLTGTSLLDRRDLRG
jgi:hypothetical protein